MPPESLEAQHTPRAVADRLEGPGAHSYLGDFVLGAIDGTVTTFAVVAGVAGAELSASVALIMGAANLLADGFSMAAGNYLSTKSEREVVERIRRTEKQHIERVPQGEREEVRQIFAAKGFSGELLEQIVQVITEDQRRWIDTMITEEHGLRLQSPSPWRAASVTFVAFFVTGLVPLIPYCIELPTIAQHRFLISSVATAGAFFAIGAARGHVVHRPLWLTGVETLVVGGVAAALAYGVGLLLKGLLGG